MKVVQYSAEAESAKRLLSHWVAWSNPGLEGSMSFTLGPEVDEKGNTHSRFVQEQMQRHLFEHVHW